jgi:hypothetical protein
MKKLDKTRGRKVDLQIASDLLFFPIKISQKYF